MGRANWTPPWFDKNIPGTGGLVLSTRCCRRPVDMVTVKPSQAASVSALRPAMRGMAAGCVRLLEKRVQR
jgi:hypothetical protein